MQLLIMRHGSAFPVSAQYDERKRPLTQVGIAEATRAAEYAASRGIVLDEIRSSPYARAFQTATILAHILKVKALNIDPAITPEDRVEDLLEYLKFYSGPSLALVSHQPLVSLLVGELIGSDADGVSFAPANFILLELNPATISTEKAVLVDRFQ